MTTKRFPLLVAAGCALLCVRPVFAAPFPDEAVVTVDGVPVTRGTLDQTLEGVYGEQVLPQLIDNQLLTNALTARGQSVSDAEVDAELARLEAQDETIKTALEASGTRVQVIKNQVRRNLTVQKLLIARVAEPTPAQLQTFFATYSAYYAIPTQNRLGLLATSTKARADQLTKALKANPTAFDALVEQQKLKATTDPIAGQSTADVGRFETPDEFATSRGIPPQMVAALIKSLPTAKTGQVLPTQALAPTGPYLIVKVVEHKAAIRPTLAQMQREVTTDYKMAQVATAEIKKNPQNPQKLEDNLRQVKQYMEQPNPQTGAPGSRPSLHDMLTLILRPASSNSLDYLRSHSSVVIADPTYRDVASQYKKQP